MVFFALFYWMLLPGFASDFLQNMSLEEKVGQVLMVHVFGDETGDEAKRLVQDVKVGGIIYYNWANSLTSSSEVCNLSLGLQKLAEKNHCPIPLLIAVDQEGGLVSRLREGFTDFPGNRALGATGDETFAEQAAYAIGEELRSVGINMNLAPVVDVNNNPRNPVIGIRSFGDDPKKVASFGERTLFGFKRANIIATLKHFPGHGDVEVDSHEDLPVVHKSKGELEKVELFPFVKLAGLADAIMTAHLLVPALDPEFCSTLSEKTLNYLRETIGFQGVIVSDSLLMQGVLKTCGSIEKAALAAMQAGCDILILGGRMLTGKSVGLELRAKDVAKVHRFIVKAVQEGRLSEARLDQAVSRILSLKERYIPKKHQDALSFALEEHRILAQNIALCALQTIEKEPGRIFEFDDKKVFITAPCMMEKTLSSFCKIGKENVSYFFKGLNPTDLEIEKAVQKAESADALIVCSYNGWKNPAAVHLTELLLNMGKPSVLLVVRDPLDSVLFPQADLIFLSFSPSAPSIQAIYDRLISK